MRAKLLVAFREPSLMEQRETAQPNVVTWFGNTGT